MEIRRWIAAGLVALGLGAGVGGAAQAADFRVVDYRGQKALLLHGDIVEGDAIRFALMRDRVMDFPHGHRVLLLNSPGGSVDEAMLIAELMRHHNFHAVVREGEECVSACASVVFLAGRLHTVEEGGILGQHSCSVMGVSDYGCNAEMARYATTLGTAHASVAHFVASVGPDDTHWFSRLEADRWGLTRYFNLGGASQKRPAPRLGSDAAPVLAPMTQGWLVDFQGEGYRAFLRPQSDYGKPVELSLWCRKSAPSEVLLALTVEGSPDSLKNAVRGLAVEMGGARHELPVETISQAGHFASLIVRLPGAGTADLIETQPALSVSMIDPEGRESPLATVQTTLGAENLAFAFDHCDGAA
ncbi:MAG: hypothetical protein Q4F71_00295 [Paracoccus sp. (in: a-proteobacteria)]|nr:hypothetical protein [Paracoccus sp. (in: a-proteobacteria)]